MFLSQEYDEFRNGVKQRIMNWQENLKARDITDWLIIHVVYNDKSNTTKSKISLTRNNVYDRIKNDLCSKDGTRSVNFILYKKLNTDCGSKIVAYFLS